MVLRELKRAAQMLIPWLDMWMVRDLLSFLLQTQNVISISMKLL